METNVVTTSVADLAADRRQAAETLIGHPLNSDQIVCMLVMEPGRVPTAAEKASALARLEKLYERIDRHADECGYH